jgi:2'-5' RNA ligase
MAVSAGSVITISESRASFADQSAVVVPVREVDQIVSRYRDRLDRSAAWGVPAHVTILYPFVAPALITPSVIALLAHIVSSVEAFKCRFESIHWFDKEVIWLAPRPDEPFRALLAAVSAGFPSHKPYGGEYEALAPHLTVGDIDCAAGGIADLEEAERDIARLLPISASIRHASLMIGRRSPGSWRVIGRLPLADSTSP